MGGWSLQPLGTRLCSLCTRSLSSATATGETRRSFSLMAKGPQLPYRNSSPPPTPPPPSSDKDIPLSSTAPASSSVSPSSSAPRSPHPHDMTPDEMVDYLDRHIVGQQEAKRSLAVAFRNRWRRRQIQDDDLRGDIVPKNILMVGPTGVGKTEIARRLSKLLDAPFIKVEATKFTEVGFRGKDVDQIIKDLAEVSVKLVQQRICKDLKPGVMDAIDRALVKALVGRMSESEVDRWLKHLRNGDLESREVEMEIVEPLFEEHVEMLADSRPWGLGGKDRGSGGRGGSSNYQAPLSRGYRGRYGTSGSRSTFSGTGGFASRRSVAIKDARSILSNVELARASETPEMERQALEACEQEGIVFIDEIDKVCSSAKSRGGDGGPDCSSEGVQRDLLPLIEGCEIETRIGPVKTDFILFIAAGAFHSTKPKDLMAELQGRLPVRVGLQSMKRKDLERVLTEPAHNLLEQHKKMLEAEGLSVSFTKGAVKEIARVAEEMNTTTENIGARRLNTIMERVMEEISFNAPDLKDSDAKDIEINKAHVRKRLSEVVKRRDLKKYLL
uniref:AAA+ ATPase domain-containing protein n=1 Tax=Chromera velia CCMP2878 TaxID=1169474 RepID=A0A0G4F498_9ALVE|eukprot:Cvel_14968.t1-p1 / transcript=Cvel_14968.t1 / gene=Cvel_14968 / organism=Chromera_velia_CCMP2878 / gene_product=ATP-dependent protease ATPase subunit HslU, putative / transcript_product=ATP-dependent protease ATPase subunit HslU, putative / location=Cvel_scaffold1087:18982-24938(-) / protein_length=555 / sequence_SO=supercontig / SO=protein_coding / is_pseudo=false